MAGKAHVYKVSWFARGIGRRTTQAFRRWDRAVAWWAYVGRHAAKITCGGRDVTPSWPGRRIGRALHAIANAESEITRLELAAVRRALRRPR